MSVSYLDIWPSSFVCRSYRARGKKACRSLLPARSAGVDIHGREVHMVLQRDSADLAHCVERSHGREADLAVYLRDGIEECLMNSCRDTEQAADRIASIQEPME